MYARDVSEVGATAGPNALVRVASPFGGTLYRAADRLSPLRGDSPRFDRRAAATFAAELPTAVFLSPFHLIAPLRLAHLRPTGESMPRPLRCGFGVRVAFRRHLNGKFFPTPAHGGDANGYQERNRPVRRRQRIARPTRENNRPTLEVAQGPPRPQSNKTALRAGHPAATQQTLGVVVARPSGDGLRTSVRRRHCRRHSPSRVRAHCECIQWPHLPIAMDCISPP